jgi:hypothetical protein
MGGDNKVVDLTNDEEFQGLVREAAGAPNGAKSPSSKPKTKGGGGGGSNTIWKVLGFIVVGIIVLFATDSIEIQRANQGDSGGDMDGRPLGAGHVEMKKPKNELPVSQPTTEETPAATTSNEEITSPAETPAAATSNEEVSSPADNGSTSTEETPATGGGTADDVGELTERHTYKPRGQPLSDAGRQAMLNKRGSWTLVDDKPRPSKDFYKKYTNRDVPRSEFPSNAWQIDKDYLAKFLPEALALVKRTQEGILAEYGKTEGTWEERTEMFRLETYEDQNLTDVQWKKDFFGDNGGWTTKRSWLGLKRRLLHAVMTEDSFVFAMGGHSSSAGHG